MININLQSSKKKDASTRLAPGDLVRVWNSGAVYLIPSQILRRERPILIEKGSSILKLSDAHGSIKVLEDSINHNPENYLILKKERYLITIAEIAPENTPVVIPESTPRGRESLVVPSMGIVDNIAAIARGEMLKILEDKVVKEVQAAILWALQESRKGAE